MGSNIGNGVSLRGLTQDQFNYVFLAATGITIDDIGKAVSFKSNTANTVQLAGDGEFIVGNILSFEDRTTEGLRLVTVQTEGGYLFPLNPNATASSPDELPVPGEFIVGGTASGGGKGYVQRAQTSDRSKFMVVELKTISSVNYVVAISV